MAKYTYALGRRKTSVATVRLYEGKGETLINEKALNIAYTKQYDKKVLLAAIKGLNQNQFTLYATLHTNQFLQENKISTRLVYKISDTDQKPNLADLIIRK